ncbi:MAG: threonine-phosphate decarboxylase CobD [Desulfuromonadaceae bacterium]|nr:threonine-phosphate decarboxylase CobD [Desulfuromonadaceae bacterium]
MLHSYDHGGNIFTVARQLGLQPEQIFDFSASINPLGMSSDVRRSLICSIDSLMHYPDTSHADLKQSLATFHNLTGDHFAVANGSTELIYNLPALIKGKRALIVSPSFSEYERALNQHQWDVKHFILTHENDFYINIDDLSSSLATGVDALFLCNPGNPNGTLYPQHVVQEIYSLCESAGTFLVLDEAFMDFCEESSSKYLIARSKHSVLLRSMTKFFGIPGLRLGYAICNADFAQQLDVLGGPWKVNTLALSAGVAALRDTHHNQLSLEYISRERQQLFTGLTAFRAFKVHPSSANYLLVEIINGMTSGELKARLLPNRILIRDCGSFTGLTNFFFRVAVRTSEENNQLLKCLCRILK